MKWVKKNITKKIEKENVLVWKPAVNFNVIDQNGTFFGNIKVCLTNSITECVNVLLEKKFNWT